LLETEESYVNLLRFAVQNMMEQLEDPNQGECPPKIYLQKNGEGIIILQF
jgi:hypothetical protein